MKYKTFAAAAVAGMILAAGAVQAASLKLVDGGVAGGFAAGVIPGGTAGNELLGPLGLPNPLGGFFGSAVELVGSGKITVEFFGWEAGFKNDFNFGGVELFTTNGVGGVNVGFPIGTFTSGLLAGGGGTLLDFSFDVTNGGSPTNTIVNGSENTGGIRDFFASVDGAPAATMGSAVWLFLDDGGSKADDNHDDMAIRLSVTPVPVPAAGFLLLAGLGGLAAMKRRKKA